MSTILWKSSQKIYFLYKKNLRRSLFQIEDIAEIFSFIQKIFHRYYFLYRNLSEVSYTIEEDIQEEDISEIFSSLYAYVDDLFQRLLLWKTSFRSLIFHRRPFCSPIEEVSYSKEDLFQRPPVPQNISQSTAPEKASLRCLLLYTFRRSPTLFNTFLTGLLFGRPSLRTLMLIEEFSEVSYRRRLRGISFC